VILWIDGAFIPAGAARIDPRDRGFLLGDGVFETFAVERGGVLALGAHLARFRRSAQAIGLRLPVSDDALRRALAATIETNGLGVERAAVRITLTRGTGPPELLPPDPPSPRLLIAATPAGPPPSVMRAVIAHGVRRNEHSPMARIKSLSHLDAVLARMEAAERGAEEALMRNAAGNLASASAANLFLIADGACITPAVSEGALPGVTRALVLDLALRHGLGVREESIPVAALESAEEAFLTSSLLGLCPLIGVDGRRIGAGDVGPLTRRFRRALGNAHEHVEALLAPSRGGPG